MIENIKKYTSIGSFANVVKYINGRMYTPPIISYRGYVKTHGTNAGISSNMMLNSLGFNPEKSIG